jgi:hypothetical protein
VGVLAYPDLLALWWDAHADYDPGHEPPREQQVHAWGRGALPEVVLDRWDTEPARAGDSRPLAPLLLRELSDAPVEQHKHWIEVRVIDEADAPVRGVKLTLVRPDGARERASTDDDGVARWRKLPSGRARVIFDDGAATFAEVG